MTSNGIPTSTEALDVVNLDSDYEDLTLPDEDDGPSSLPAGDSLRRMGRIIPFRSIHKAPVPFKDFDRQVFLPGKEISVKIADVERSVATHIIHPNLYVIHLQHGEFTWIIRRRYKHFQHLHNQLQLFRASLSIPFPTRTHRVRRSSYKPKMKDKEGGKSKSALPRFPKKPDALVPVEQLTHRMQQLEEYLQNLLKITVYRNHHDTLEFLEVSHLSFVHDLGVKGKEGIVEKRTGHSRPRRATCGLCGVCYKAPCLRFQRMFGDCCGQWRTRWMLVKDNFVAYVRPKDGMLKCVMLMDQAFEVSAGLYETGFPNGLVLSNLSRQLVVKLWTKRKAKEWLEYIKNTVNNTGKEFTQPNRYNSFAPVRTQIDATWFVDGSSYMEAVADAIESAQEEIFITDWWLSPEIYLKRPIMEGDRWRLDKVLQRKAKQGVKIFVMLYKEVEFALGINSFYSKQKLVEQHPENIKVFRHPDHVSAGVFLWAHHEKLVIVDQSYAFVGGIDLCYGRWDDYKHRLTDLGSIGPQNRPMAPYQRKVTSSRPGGMSPPASILQLARSTNTVTIGMMQSNLQPDVAEKAIKMNEPVVELGAAPGEGIDTVDNEPALESMKGETPKMGRRSVVQRMRERSKQLAEGFREEGFDFLHYFRWRRNSQDEDPVVEESEEKKDSLEDLSAVAVNEAPLAKEEVGLTELAMRHSPSESLEHLDGLQGSAKLWLGKDYTNFIVKDFSNLDIPFQDLVDRGSTPRMPWHDIALMVQGKAARDAARHFIQRWNAIKEEKAKLHNSYPYLLPKSTEDVTQVPPILNLKMHSVNSQLLRSVSQWSAGIQMIEDSIHQAYIEAIANARHYIYVENQFFITQSNTCMQVQNQIGEALLQRILRAHREGAKFRVFVVMPLLPGFEGEFGTVTGTAIQAITHWNYASMCRGEEGLLTRMKANGIEDPSEFIAFCGLRTHSELHGDLVTELIYVHSKLLIVDDNLVICGSANINDRSMLGKRDSEVAVVIQDEDREENAMIGQPFKSGSFAGSLRRQLFKEHLGLIDKPREDINIDEPMSDGCYKDAWLAIARRNMEIYDDVFRVIPTNKVRNFNELKDYQSKLSLSVTDPVLGGKMLEEIQGNLVLFPIHFLCQEDLTPAAGTKEAFMPTSLWT